VQTDGPRRLGDSLGAARLLARSPQERAFAHRGLAVRRARQLQHLIWWVRLLLLRLSAESSNSWTRTIKAILAVALG